MYCYFDYCLLSVARHEKKTGYLLLFLTILAVVLSAGAAADVSFFEHNERAETVVRGKITDVTLPITWSAQGHALVSVSVNGKPDLLFGLDTGAPLTLIFGHKRTEAVPLRMKDDVAIHGNGTGDATIGKLVDSLDIAFGPVEIRGLKGVWIDWEDVPFFPSESAVYVDGIIGYDLFNRFVIELDTKDDALRLYDSVDQIPVILAPPIPLSIEDRRPYSEVKVIIDQNKPTPIVRDALIDTGSVDHLELIIPANPTAAFPPLPKKLVPNSDSGFQGTTKGRIGRVDHLAFGNFGFADMLIEFAEPHAGASEEGAQLGMGILSRFDLIFDYQGEQFFLIERPDSFTGFELDMSGMALEQRDQDIVVSDVRPGTSADKANFRSGDTITRIEGIKTFSLKTARSLLRSGDGKKVSVCRQTRKGGKCKMLRLQRQI